MEKMVCHPTLGEIKYEEGVWTGKKALTINGEKLLNVKKNIYKYQDNEVLVKGNFIIGVTIQINDEKILIVEKLRWYDIILGIIPFIVGLAWNFTPFMKVYAVAGGAIGGAVDGLIAFFAIFLIKRSKKNWLKILFSIAFSLGAILINYTLIINVLGWLMVLS